MDAAFSVLLVALGAASQTIYLDNKVIVHLCRKEYDEADHNQRWSIAFLSAAVVLAVIAIGLAAQEVWAR